MQVFRIFMLRKGDLLGEWIDIGPRIVRLSTDEKQVWFELDGKRLRGIATEGAGAVPKPDAVRDLYVIET